MATSVVGTGHVVTRALRFTQGVRGAWIAEPIAGLHFIIRHSPRGYVHAGTTYDTFAAARDAAEARFARALRDCVMVVPATADAPDRRAA